MGRLLLTLVLLCWLLLPLPDLYDSFPLCMDESAPVALKTPLFFCPYNGSVCCDSAQDQRLQKRFQSMNISDSACASLVKSILCATCDKFSGDLFKNELGYRTVPVLCNSTASDDYCSEAAMANPTEVRRIFTMGLPFTAHHGGQILFGPNDGYLYFMMGDGGGTGDPYNFAQNKKSLLGKIMRLDIDNFTMYTEAQLAMTMGLIHHEPLKKKDSYESVDLISRGGNYGWRVYDGFKLYYPPESPGGNTSASSISTIFPVMGYYHSAVNGNDGSASVTGGYFYRGTTDPCMYGRYLYADLYAQIMWAGIESPDTSGNFTSHQIPFSCAPDSPIKCNYAAGSALPALGNILSFGEDNRKDIFFLTSNGVYRVAHPSRCNYTCSLENVTAAANPASTPSLSQSSGILLTSQHDGLVLLFSSFFILMYFIL
ncbi:hypothetical protein NE237_021066 [Protea cynaroides]|uniref:Glucose/Sorbosone dehydrogenase domain-containing protein n=1 Tax=Protea cynaroides TaxID=273540 RepID=A0A9Q0K2Y0_9MAGN|nr:hypothetical protein NE237_021066 [Protea cynaroides]